MRIELKELLQEYGCSNTELIHSDVISDCNLSFLQLRDRLYILGTILYEDTENHVYVASIRSGLGNMNSAIVAMQLRSNKLTLAGYAKEGIIKQNILGKALQKLTATIQNQPSSNKKNIVPKILLFLALSIVAVTGFLFTSEVHKTIEATKKYNTVAEQYNTVIEKYNSVAAITSIDNIDGLPQNLEPLAIEALDFWSNARVVLGKNSKDKIAADAQTIQGIINKISPAVTVISQITAPDETWVAKRLSDVEGITGTQAVSKELDPDDLLNKEGGYSACIYFTYNAINSEEVPGDTIVEKGTDAGGAIEIYPTLSDATARCEYLAGFDGTVLYSGSYAIIGTMVIRTSYKLTDEQQFNLTSAITSALTALK